MTRARVDKLQSLIVADLRLKLEEVKTGFAETAQEDELEAYDTTLTWLMGLTHGKRPPRMVITRAFRLRERFTYDMVELARRIAIANGDLDTEEEHD